MTRLRRRHPKGMLCLSPFSMSGVLPYLRIDSFGGLLDYYDVELQHLTPNGVQHMAAFVALCEGFLGIDPHFDLWRYFFTISLSKRWVGGKEVNVPMGCASIHLHHTRSRGYPYMHPATSNKGWHS